VTLVSTLLVNGPLGEEPGWRGFALSRLQARFGVLPATISLGVLWALWHLPLSLSGPTTDQRPPLQFALSLVAMSFLYSWLAARTSGSVLLAMLLHASTNTVAGFFFRTYGEVPGYGRLWWCYVGAWSVVALVLLGRGLARRRTTPAAPGLLTADLRARQKESGLTMEHS
jgi:membrane protease YdiL (CAAX protease family)